MTKNIFLNFMISKLLGHPSVDGLCTDCSIHNPELPCLMSGRRSGLQIENSYGTIICSVMYRNINTKLFMRLPCLFNKLNFKSY